MLIPAAQYLRMSTEHQQYSINNQARLISEYAKLNGFAIVNTFEDSVKSGLSLKSRPALQQLLHEVVFGRAVFKAILVYDVSRWGRFQDVDEAAHYEFLCRNTCIPIHYCAEQFVNQGSMESSILKTLKRAMAAEFSRELGEKVYRGQSQLVRMGFKMGGRSTYGLRRMLVSSEGCPKQLLRLGERKSIQNDRVIVVPGDEKELAVVREIFAMAQNGMRPQHISENLNQRGIRFSEATPDWNRQTVANLIRNPVYAGCNATPFAAWVYAHFSGRNLATPPCQPFPYWGGYILRTSSAPGSIRRMVATMHYWRNQREACNCCKKQLFGIPSFAHWSLLS